METTIKITAICGWALPEEWFCQLVKSYFPKAEVRACYPENPGDKEEAAEILGSSLNWVIGYSLGSLWLMVHKHMIPPQAKVILIAPIFAFPAEKNMGGTTPLAKLKYQKKMLSSSEDYISSLKGFFDLSGIRLPEKDFEQSHSRETLIRGLEFLETACVPPSIAQNCITITGMRDPLSDSNRLKELVPHLVLLEDCDHSPHKMLSHVSKHIDSFDGSSLHASQSTFHQRTR